MLRSLEPKLPTDALLPSTSSTDALKLSPGKGLLLIFARVLIGGSGYY